LTIKKEKEKRDTEAREEEEEEEEEKEEEEKKRRRRSPVVKGHHGSKAITLLPFHIDTKGYICIYYRKKEKGGLRDE